MSFILAVALSLPQNASASMSTDPVKAAAICTWVAASVISSGNEAAIMENNKLINAWSARYAKLARVSDDDYLMSSPGMEEASQTLSSDSDAILHVRLAWCRAHKPVS